MQIYIYIRLLIKSNPIMARQLVYAEDILDDAEMEKREDREKQYNKEYVETLQNMDVSLREMLEDMFAIVKRHEKINKNIKKDFHVSLQALQAHYTNTEAYTKYRDIQAFQKKVEETTENKRSLFISEKERYFKRHYIRMRNLRNVVEQYEQYLDQAQLVDGARDKVLYLREIQKFKNRNALAQIEQWDLTFDDETFDQLQVVDSTLVSDDAYKNVISKKY